MGYAECEAQKTPFNARCGDYVDLATTEWRAAARFDDVLALSVTTERLGTTSLVLAVEFRRQGQTTLLACNETIYVMVSLPPGKLPLPEPFRAARAGGAADIVVGHAD